MRVNDNKKTMGSNPNTGRKHTVNYKCVNKDPFPERQEYVYTSQPSKQSYVNFLN